MKAKEYLQQIKKLDRLIENKLIEKQQWKVIATNTTASSESVMIDGKKHGLDRVQSSGSQQKMADAVCRYIDIDNEIDRYVDLLFDTKIEVIKTIEQLPATEYDLLHKMYIQFKTLDEVADAYQKTYTWATTVHGRALKNLQGILNGGK